MNVYDFDKTIYKKDCSVEFYKFVIKKKPLLILRCLPIQIMAILQYKVGMITKKRLKEQYFTFLQYIETDTVVRKFAEQEIRNVEEWYHELQRKDDVIVTASPEFLVWAFAEKLGIVHVLGTVMDKNTGRIDGENCRGKEKVARFEKIFSARIENFYSDSLSDLPMAEKANKAFLVKKGKLTLWNRQSMN